MQHFFVYGLLLFPELVTALTGKSFRYSPVTLHGFKRCRITGCDYPALIEEPGSKTEGFLIENVDEASKDILTFFEGDEYEKRQITVSFSNKKISVTSFVWIADKSLLENRDWNVNEFKKKSLGYYLSDVVPETLAAFRSLNS